MDFWSFYDKRFDKKDKRFDKIKDDNVGLIIIKYQNS
jgi:hypothetical protein